jgi:hypothetical protein
MRNWKLVAAGLDAGLSEAEVERIAPALDALEAAFRPLAAALDYEAEPAVTFEASPEERP